MFRTRLVTGILTKFGYLRHIPRTGDRIQLSGEEKSRLVESVTWHADGALEVTLYLGAYPRVNEDDPIPRLEAYDNVISWGPEGSVTSGRPPA